MGREMGLGGGEEGGGIVAWWGCPWWGGGEDDVGLGGEGGTGTNPEGEMLSLAAKTNLAPPPPPPALMRINNQANKSLEKHGKGIKAL